MHTVHVDANEELNADGTEVWGNGFTHAALGIMFSVNDYTVHLSDA